MNLFFCLSIENKIKKWSSQDHFPPGFTLVEVMVCVAIVGVLAAIAVTNFIAYIERARVAAAISDIKNIEKSAYNFFVDNGQLPDSLAQIGCGGIRDPWGNGYRYLRIDGAPNNIKGSSRKDHFMVPVNSDFDLYSMGRDGSSVPPFTAKASQDDIVRAFNGGYVGKVEDM